MKNYFASLLLLLSAATALSSCRETSKLPEPAYENIPIIFPEINPEKASFDYNAARVSVNDARRLNVTRPVFEFVINPSKGYTEIQTVIVYKSFSRAGVLGPRVKQTEVSEFPATITLDSQQALDGLYPSSQTYTVDAAGQPTTVPVRPLVLAVKGANDGAPNRIDPPTVQKNAIVFTFEYVMKDGRKITLAQLNPAVNTASSGSLLPSSFVNTPLAAVAEFK